MSYVEDCRKQLTASTLESIVKVILELLVLHRFVGADRFDFQTVWFWCKTIIALIGKHLT